MRKLLRVTTLVGFALAGIVVSATPASAATSITTPSTSPFIVPGDVGGNPTPFTVNASGFPASSNVFIEQCDGVAPTAVGWDPTTNCDLGSSPAAAVADANGDVTFDAADVNHALHPFKGSSPQELFNCLSLNDPSPNNGLTDYRTCKLRVSSSNSNATADQVFLTLVLPDDPNTPPPPPLKVSMGGAAVVEGNTSNRAMTFTVTLSRVSLLPVTVDYTTVAGTAVAPSDYIAKTGHLTIPAGATSGAIGISINGDVTREKNQSFKVRLSNPTGGATILGANGTGSILTDDPPLAGVRVSVGNASLYEGNSGERSLRFTVSLSSPHTKSVKVDYATSDVTATAGSDYTARNGTLTIAKGKRSGLVNVPIAADDTAEPHESFLVSLSNPVRALIKRTSGSGSIFNDD